MACVENHLAFDTSTHSSPASSRQAPLPVHLLSSERNFYNRYSWSLNIYPTVEEAIQHLRNELENWEGATEPWQSCERMTNGYLLSCAILNELDDYLAGKRYDLSKAGRIPLGRLAVRVADITLERARKMREHYLKSLKRWRERWLTTIVEYLVLFTSAGSAATLVSECRNRLLAALEFELPERLKRRRLKNPAFFHGRDLTHFDVLKLGEKFVAEFPDRNRPLVLVGLRTAGSYFAPLLCAYLTNEGYHDVAIATMRPRSVLGWSERAHLARCAKQNRTAVIVDESPIGGGSTAAVVKGLRNMGFAEDKIVALLPVHRLYRDWENGWKSAKITKARAIVLAPEEWYKHRILAPEAAQKILRQYFEARGYLFTEIVNSSTAARFNSQLQSSSDEKYHTRHKRIYEVSLQTGDGGRETRYVLAKSVGWGWLSYHAFITAERLSRFVPPVLGLRNGFLYTEWRPEVEKVAPSGLNGHLGHIASYVVTRSRLMPLTNDPTRDLLFQKQHRASDELISTLSRAYCSKMARFLKRPRMQRELARRTCPVPTFIDGKMRAEEWIMESSAMMKTDFEHHGFGKGELELTDPAYDLAETILHFKLAKEEEKKLIEEYIRESGDQTVGKRLFLNKLLAGTQAMNQALANLRDARLVDRFEKSNQQYLDACNFLTVHTLRMCAGLCSPAKSRSWRSPLIVLDIDGVLDTPVFGFPCTSAAGIRAISLLHSHDFAVAFNTARSISEIKEYCDAYSFVGGVAEYGSSIWDALAREERVLVSPEALEDIEKLKNALRKLPGVFLNDDYKYSVRAYTYGKEQTAPLPTMMIQNLMASLKLNEVRLHQTGLDTAVIAKDVDKGTGLLELMARTGENDPMVIAIGDSDPDLAMFRIAKRSFSPSHIWCRNEAEKLGCKIAKQSYQSGLLESVRSIVHAGGKLCERCHNCDALLSSADRLVLSLLNAADQKRIKLLVKAVLDPLALRAFA